ncbi:hypothetical protein, partial [Agromyces terreus]
SRARLPTNPASIKPGAHHGDSCSKADFTVGIRFPHNIPADEYGGHAMTIRITAEAGDVEQNRIMSEIQLVDDTACDEEEAQGAIVVLNYCMGLMEISPDDGTPQRRAILGAARGWTAPDRCWFSEGWGEVDPVPSQACGQSRPTDPVPVTSVTRGDATGTSGWPVELIHKSDDSWWPMAPYGSAMPALNSFVPASNGDVTDVRAWVGDFEAQVPSEGWEFVADQQAQEFRLSNEDFHLNSGWGDLGIVRDFFEDGWLSFRVDAGSTNWIRLNDLTDDAGDPFECVAGEVIDDDDREWFGIYGDVYVTVGWADKCRFESKGVPFARNDLASFASLGTPSLAVSTPGFSFQGAWWQVWIPRKYDAAWVPPNGSTITVSYTDPLTEQQVPFASGVQNQDELRVRGESLTLAGFDPLEPIVSMEVTQALGISPDCNYAYYGVYEDLPECEIMIPHFDLSLEDRNPVNGAGMGWRALAENGGTISFTTDHGTATTISVVPGSYSSGNRNDGGGPGRPVAN